MFFICSPNNPTGAVYSRKQLEKWVDFARDTGSLIIYDSAYESFIDGDFPHSIYEIDGAKQCAVEICSLSKSAGFTGMRCAWTVVPSGLSAGDVSLNALWARRQATKFNGVAYIIQRAAEAALSDEGRAQCAEAIRIYKENAHILSAPLDEKGIFYTGGRSSPYIWMRCPGGMGSWEFFDLLLEKAQTVGTPGEGFGSAGAGISESPHSENGAIPPKPPNGCVRCSENHIPYSPPTAGTSGRGQITRAAVCSFSHTVRSGNERCRRTAAEKDNKVKVRIGKSRAADGGVSRRK